MARAVFLLTIAIARAGLAADAPPPVGEVEFAKGMIHFNAKRYAEAEKHFRLAVESEVSRYLAFEFLAASSEQRGDLNAAVEWLLKEKPIAPQDRKGLVDFNTGRVYELLKQPDRARRHLLLALESGTLPARSAYMLGHIDYKESNLLDAEHWFHEAKRLAEERELGEADLEALQAANYYLAEIYSRTGYERYALRLARESEIGDGAELRTAAWKLHSELNHQNYYVSFTEEPRYDSNPVLLPFHTNAALRISGKSSVQNYLAENMGWRSTPAHRLSFGADAGVSLLRNLSYDLHEFDRIDLRASVFGEQWNLKDIAWRLEYDVAQGYSDRESFSSLTQLHAVTLSRESTFSQRWAMAFGIQGFREDFPSDPDFGADRRSGWGYSAFARVGQTGPNPRLRPWVRYAYTRDLAAGENFRSATHSVDGVIRWQVTLDAAFDLEIGWSESKYPQHTTERSDRNLRGGLTFTQRFGDHWSMILGGSSTNYRSTFAPLSYDRAVGTGGVRYAF